MAETRGPSSSKPSKPLQAQTKSAKIRHGTPSQAVARSAVLSSMEPFVNADRPITSK